MVTYCKMYVFFYTKCIGLDFFWQREFSFVCFWHWLRGFQRRIFQLVIITKTNQLGAHTHYRHDNKTCIHGYLPKPLWFDGFFFFTLTKFRYEFGFSLISKHGYGMDNRDIGTNLRPIPKPISECHNYYFISALLLPFYLSCYLVW